MGRIEWVTENHAELYRQFWYRLGGSADDELDWKIHPDANSIRWIVQHLLFIEEWTADMLEGTGKYLTNKDPKRYDPASLQSIRRRYDKAFARTQRNLTGTLEDDLAREIDMIGVITAPLSYVLNNHVHHFAGHMYQIRFIRGAYSRAHGVDKAAFDRW